MANNPLVSQGKLNRLRASIVIPNFPSLNITASFLGKQMIGLALEGPVTTFIPTAVGAAQSPEPYQMVGVSVNLLKTQNLADLYKTQIESSSDLGQITVIPDASTLSNYVFYNCAIRDVKELTFNGEDAGYMITLGGYYPVNNDQWNLL